MRQEVYAHTTASQVRLWGLRPSPDPRAERQVRPGAVRRDAAENAKVAPLGAERQGEAAPRRQDVSQRERLGAVVRRACRSALGAADRERSLVSQQREELPRLDVAPVLAAPAWALVTPGAEQQRAAALPVLPARQRGEPQLEVAAARGLPG